MDDLPTGTLTLLFSDIEASTRLLSRLGDRYAEVLSAQRAILRSAFGRWRGREMGTEGDSFFVVFSSVGGAIGAALQAQRELTAYPWPDGVAVRVRMGLHTGEPTRHEDGYVGMDVHRAARVAGSAHGSQVMLSEATYRIAAAQRLDGVRYIDLGRHRLKDLPEAEHLFQLVAEGLERRFPPPKSLGAAASLPVPSTSIVGRDGELRELQELMAAVDVRLVTLTGPGGTGKTRLAIALAALLDGSFGDGVYFVPLESVESADAMWTTIAEVLGVTGEGRAPPTFLEYVAPRELLLVLDNLEQLPEAASIVDQLLATGPGVRIVATSRRPLHLSGEHEHPVPPLTLPDAADVDGVGDSGAVRLFVQRARMVRADFSLSPDNLDDVVDICRRMDGLPLGIELVAARLRLLAPRALRARLDKSLELTGPSVGRPTRQQTLRSTIAWSYALLSPDSRSVFRRLGVFSGDFDLDAVAAVTRGDVDPLDQVAALVDASLARVRDGVDGEPRLRLLQTVATYARERLAEEGELEDARRQHAEHYLAVAEATSPQLRSPHYLVIRDRIEADLDNLRAALGWSLRADTPERPPTQDELVIGLRLCQALSWFWYACGYSSEGRRWLASAVDTAAGRHSPELISAMHSLAVLLLLQGETEQGRDMLETCLAFWRREGDPSRIAMELNSLGVAYRSLGEPDTARRLFAEGITLARGAGEHGRLANLLSNLAMIELDEEQPVRAAELLNQALEIDRKLGDTWAEAVDHVNLAGAMLRSGDVRQAYQRLVDNGPGAVALGDVDLTVSVVEMFCMVLAELGDVASAARLLGAATAMRGKAELPLPAPDAAMLEKSIGRVRRLPDAATWDHNVRVGTDYSVDDALAEALNGPSPVRPADAAVDGP